MYEDLHKLGFFLIALKWYDLRANTILALVTHISTDFECNEAQYI